MQGVALLLVTLSGLSGCGQKGPLYLPEDPAAKQQSPSPAPQGEQTTK
jgi:predicted small lipoprotein YifL